MCSNPKLIEIKIEDRLSIEDALVVHGKGPQSEGLRVVMDGRSSAIDIDASGQVRKQVAGKSAPGETTTEVVCRTLLARINAGSGTDLELIAWQRAGQGDNLNLAPDVDGAARDKRTGNRVDIQVVKADERPWADLGCGKSYERTESVEDAAASFWRAIRHKTPGGRGQRSIVLALDAYAFPVSLEPLANAFERNHGYEAERLGWQAIWIVGPTPEFTFKLA
jgi:hypothetical protein